MNSQPGRTSNWVLILNSLLHFKRFSHHKYMPRRRNHNKCSWPFYRDGVTTISVAYLFLVPSLDLGILWYSLHPLSTFISFLPVLFKRKECQGWYFSSILLSNPLIPFCRPSRLGTCERHTKGGRKTKGLSCNHALPPNLTCHFRFSQDRVLNETHDDDAYIFHIIISLSQNKMNWNDLFRLCFAATSVTLSFQFRHESQQIMGSLETLAFFFSFYSETTNVDILRIRVELFIINDWRKH